MEKNFKPQDIETSHYTMWEKSGYFAPTGQGTAYSIVIPPPNVTGTLHMGHAFQHTIMDALTRYHRMKGDNTLWQPGTDHAGIATQMVVERQLLAEGKTRHSLGREAFIEKIWEWKAYSGDNICRQMRRIGDSPDWSRERFTMDEGLSKAVTKVFVALYNEALIYKGKRLVNWDPILQTAISDLEVISTETAGHMWYIDYPLTDGSAHLTIATTRPETMLGDAAVAVHPDDKRYQHLIGKTIQLPLCDREIPIIADTYVDPEFGTGCVKITPAHDFNDYEVGKRHALPILNVLTNDAKINTDMPKPYQGLDRFEARKKIIDDLTQLKLIEKIVDHTLMVPKGDRTNAVIEPYLTDQWYVKVQPLAGPAIDAVKNGDIKFVPENWSKTYFNWMDNIEDWCISRQLWWGHRIPAWYDEIGRVYVGESEIAIRKTHNLSDTTTLTQDNDVLDTWFSSALWPFSTLNWPDKTDEIETFLPTAVLVTGFDIIFFWVARMIMMTLKFTGKIPFKDVFITGLIRDENGQKMSKSKGNVLDPIDLIDGISLDDLVKKRTTGMMQPQLAEKIKKQTKKSFPNGLEAYGTDALRFTFCALATNSSDINFDTARVDGYRNFCNKIWNASRYAITNLDISYDELEKADKTFSIADKWIMTHLETLLKQVETHFQQYRFDLASQALYEFTWNLFCDWYLELTKPVLWKRADDPSSPAVMGTLYTLRHVLEMLIKTLHPMMPFITEEIWQILREKSLLSSSHPSIMIAPWPTINNQNENESTMIMDTIIPLIREIRSLRKELNLKPSQPIQTTLICQDTTTLAALKAAQSYIKDLCKIEILAIVDQLANKPAQHTASVVKNCEIIIPLEDLIDTDAEKERLTQKRTKLQNEAQILNKKLSNQNFTAKAPAEIVEKIRTKYNGIDAEITLLTHQLAQLQ